MNRKKKKTRLLWILLAATIALAAVILLLPFCGNPETGKSTLAKIGEEAPNFTVELLDGQQVELSQLRGRVVLLNFWATWCSPCCAELKRIPQEVVERFAGRDFTLLAVSRGEDRATVENFRNQNNYTFPMGLDPDESIYDLYATNYMPRNFLIDKQGRVVKVTVGYTTEEFDKLLSAIEVELQK